MRVLINCSNLNIGGGLQVAHSFLEKISRLSNRRFIIIVSSALQQVIKDISFPDNHEVILYEISPNPFAFIRGRVAFLDELVETYSIDRVFTLLGPVILETECHTYLWSFKISIYLQRLLLFQRNFFEGANQTKIHGFHTDKGFKRYSDILVTEKLDAREKFSNLDEA